MSACALICQATTKGGKPCTNGAIDTVSGIPYCGVHLKAAQRAARKGDVQKVGDVTKQIVAVNQPKVQADQSQVQPKEAKVKINVIANAQKVEKKAAKAQAQEPAEVVMPEGAFTDQKEMLDLFKAAEAATLAGTPFWVVLAYLKDPKDTAKGRWIPKPEKRALVVHRVREYANEETGEITTYVEGYESTAHDYRTFRLDRIQWAKDKGEAPFVFILNAREMKAAANIQALSRAVDEAFAAGRKVVIPSVNAHWKARPFSADNVNSDYWGKQGFFVLGPTE